jgi:hypothetical protein
VFPAIALGDYFLPMNCYLCQEDVPLHAKYVEGAWTLACRPCDVQEDDQNEILEDQPSYDLGGPDL